MQKGRSSSDDKRRRARREIDNAAAGLSSAQLVEGAGDLFPRVIWRTAGSTVEDVASRTMRSPLFWKICYQSVSCYKGKIYFLSMNLKLRVLLLLKNRHVHLIIVKILIKF